MKKLSLLFSFVLIATNAWAIEPGTKAPNFTLKTHAGEEVTLADYADKVVVLEWFNKGCPYVVKHYKDGDMQKLQKDYKADGVVWLVINSTAESHKDYLNAEATDAVVKEWNIVDAPMLIDAEGTVGKAYSAKTTPHMYVIDKGTVVYAGAIDDNSSAHSDPKEAENYVKAALDAVLAGNQVSKSETTPYGCTVKYAG